MRDREVKVDHYGVISSRLRGEYHSVHRASLFDSAPARDTQTWFYFSKIHRDSGPAVYYGTSPLRHRWYIMGVDVTRAYSDIL